MALGDKKKAAAPAAEKEAKTDIKTGPEFTEKGAETTAGAAAGDSVDDNTAEQEKATDTEEEAALPAVAAEAGALAKPGKPVMAFVDIENAMPIIDFGVLPLFNGNNGGMFDSDNNTIGSEVVVELLSWRHKYVVTPGDDSDEAKEMVKYSDDGLVITDTQQPVAEYVAELKKDWPKTSVKDYIELTCMLEESNEPEKAAAYLNNMVQISLSPQSRKAFEAHRLQMMVKLRMKKIEVIPTQIKVTATAASFGTNKFTKLVSSEV